MTEQILNQCFVKLDSAASEMADFLCKLCSHSAIGPKSGGQGEKERVEYLLDTLARFRPTSVEEVRVDDGSTICGYRPNLVLYWKGRQPEARRIVLLSHLDTVPPGDLSRWRSDPFQPKRSGNIVWGLGVEDNGQDLVALLYAIATVVEVGGAPEQDVFVLLVADEEEGSEKGAKYFVRQNFFAQEDLILVPDGGLPSGDFIGVAEKGRISAMIKTSGRQEHASRAHSRQNAAEVGACLAGTMLNTLRTEFAGEDNFFIPPSSTFHLTRKEGNNVATNMTAACDVFFIDCRLLPTVNINDVMNRMASLCECIREEEEPGNDSHDPVRSEVEIVRLEAVQRNPHEEAACVRALRSAVKKTLRKEVHIGGHGSGSVASFLRQAGLDVAVWCTKEQVAHMPNEYIHISNMVSDAKVIAAFISGGPYPPGA